MGETVRLEAGRTADFQKFFEEIRALKNRLKTIDLARLEEQRQSALEAAVKDTGKHVRVGNPGESHRLSQDMRGFVEADYENSKKILVANFEKFEAILELLGRQLREFQSLKDQEHRASAEAEKRRKLEEELDARRTDLERAEEISQQEKKLQECAGQALVHKTREIEAKLANLEVAKRAQELDEERKDMDQKIQAYTAEMASLARMRQEFYKDFDTLGEKRAELDRDEEKLKAEREKLQLDRKNMAATVAREMALTFEAFVRDMLAPPTG